MDKTEAQEIIQAAINRAAMKDHGEFVSFPCAATAEGVFVGASGKTTYRPADEVKKMAPFCNGMRVVINHPPLNDPARVACLDLQDQDYPVIGWYDNAKLGKKDGVTRIEGSINIWKKRDGRDQTKTIRKIQTGELQNVSIGYFFTPETKDGVWNNAQYDLIERNINPYHLAILDGHEPAFAPPVVGIGVCETGANPYPNFHAARLHDPSKYDRFVNVDNTHPSFRGLPDGVQAILGFDGGKSEVQAYRFDKDRWTVEKAKNWLKKNKITYILFEPATEKKGSSSNSQGGRSMDGEEDQNNSGGKPQDKTMTPKDMSLEALSGQNAHVKALADENKALKEQVVKLTADLNKATEKAKAGEEAVKELETQKAETRKTKVERLKEVVGEEQFTELYPDKTAEQAPDEEIDRLLKIADLGEAAIPAEQATETNQARPQASPALKPPAVGKNVPSSGKNEDDGFLPSLFEPYAKRGAKKDGQ
jgi:hypothetical protein